MLERSRMAGCLLLATTLLCSTSSVGLASDAQTLFEEGRSALAQGRLDAACSLLAESQRLDPAPGTELNLGDCEEKRGRLKTAQEHFRAVAKTGMEPFAAEGDKRALALDGRIPTLTLVLGEGIAAADGFTLLLDGARFDPLFDRPMPLDPGPHKLVLRASGRVDFEASLVLEPAEQETLTLLLGAPVATQPASSGPPTLGVVGLVVGGVGVVALGAAIGTGVAMLGAGECFPERPEQAPDTCPSPADEDVRSRGKTLEAASTALFIIGGVFAATGLVLTLVAPWGGDEAVKPTVSFSAGPAAFNLSLSF